MHAEPTRPLSSAAAVLTSATLASVCRSPSFHRRASEGPTQLRALGPEGEVILLGRLIEQQQLEHQAQRSTAALELRRRGAAEHEILELHEIRTTLA